MILKSQYCWLFFQGLLEILLAEEETVLDIDASCEESLVLYLAFGWRIGDERIRRGFT